LASSLICGGGVLVNCRMSIFHIADLKLENNDNNGDLMRMLRQNTGGGGETTFSVGVALISNWYLTHSHGQLPLAQSQIQIQNDQYYIIL